MVKCQVKRCICENKEYVKKGEEEKHKEKEEEELKPKLRILRPRDSSSSSEPEELPADVVREHF